ncbi:hypothetical protein EYF80_041260 [Liparis tanakae]|uniref:Uncharacterized protein n=1 Tax=Liparis tanakae TaxID=230148 RepID=A0A4Z2G4L1_9TELE|nr:hypothetical protein EYF80_041260 [Liparis tanakae]
MSCVVSRGCVEELLHGELQGGFLRAGRHVGKIRPSLAAVPPEPEHTGQAAGEEPNMMTSEASLPG